MSQIRQEIRKLGPVQIFDFRVLTEKMTFFSSAKSWKNFAFADIDSYVKKSEKNIGAKIFALTIAVFCGN